MGERKEGVKGIEKQKNGGKGTFNVKERGEWRLDRQIK
jgi:hypothetical protein